MKFCRSDIEKYASKYVYNSYIDKNYNFNDDSKSCIEDIYNAGFYAGYIDCNDELKLNMQLYEMLYVEEKIC